MNRIFLAMIACFVIWFEVARSKVQEQVFSWSVLVIYAIGLYTDWFPLVIQKQSLLFHATGNTFAMLSTVTLNASNASFSCGKSLVIYSVEFANEDGDLRIAAYTRFASFESFEENHYGDGYHGLDFRHHLEGCGMIVEESLAWRG